MFRLGHWIVLDYEQISKVERNSTDFPQIVNKPSISNTDSLNRFQILFTVRVFLLESFFLPLS